MKKILIVAATAGLMSLAACNTGTTNNTAAENAAESHEANAAMYEAGADETTNAVQENLLDNAAAVEENAAEAAHDAADNAH